MLLLTFENKGGSHLRKFSIITILEMKPYRNQEWVKKIDYNWRRQIFSDFPNLPNQP